MRLVTRDHRVTLPTVVQCPTVGDKQAVIAPLITQNVDQQTFVRAARLPVQPVVTAHQHSNIRILDNVLKRRQIGGPEGASADGNIEGMAFGFGTAMHGKMLHARQRLVTPVLLLLQTAHTRGTHTRGKERILAVGFHPPAPARVAENVDVRGEKRKPRVVIVLACFLGAKVLHPRFVGDHPEHLLNGFFVESGGQRRGHRIDRGETVPRHAMQCLVPPTVRRNPQPLNRRIMMLHHPQLLIQSKLIQKQLCPLV